MQCPKCQNAMKEVTVKSITVDQCESCGGIWFDSDEAEALSGRLVSEFLDTGDPVVGEKMDEVEDINCPVCGSQMEICFDIDQSHVQWEECPLHGKFFDAGEFVTWAAAQTD